MSDLTLRAVTASEVCAVVAIAAACFDKARPGSDFLGELTATQATLLGLFDDGVLVGYLNYWRVLDEVELLEVAVHPSHRRRGLGRVLMARLHTDAKDAKDAAVVRLEVRAGNDGARALYVLLGYVEVGRRRRYYPDGEDAVLYDRRGD